jgi:uncharacterized protein (UPF0276 family)
MRYFDETTANGMVAIGLAYGSLVHRVLDANPALIDYVEIPFEQLRHAPETARIQENLPAILHCASLSMAGFVPPSQDTVASVADAAARMRTPWLGEHLAFISADPPPGEPGLPDEQENDTTLTYTVCPQYSEETVQQVIRNLEAVRARLPMPIILENSPQYFEIPGSTMRMADFVSKVLNACDIGLLLDLTHFMITCFNTGASPQEELRRMPLDRVLEVHMSGLTVQSGVAWDDHASSAPEEVFDLLPLIAERCSLRALTFEYNWSPNLPLPVIQRQVERARDILQNCRVGASV